MRAVRRWRYYCDFCKKAGGQRQGMELHEQNCTLNPVRGCRICAMVFGGSPTAMPALLALLPAGPPPAPQIGAWAEEWNPAYGAFVEAVTAAMPALREATENCPACIMAALRQAKIPVPLVESFDFGKESADLLQEFRANERTGPW